MNIFLIGFMGTGKTTVGKKLAKRLNYEFVDLDHEIVASEGREIPEIFAQEGESYFRDVETKITKKIAYRDNQVVATGGGVVTREENVKCLKENGTVVLLTAKPEEILKRTSGDDYRPLLEVEDPLAKIKGLLEERKEVYDCTSHQIDTTNLSVLEVVEKIEEEII